MKDNFAVYERLRGVIIADKGGSLPRHVLDVLRKDLTNLLGEYFVLRSVAADLDYDKEGRLWLNIDCRVDGVRPFEAVDNG